MLYECLLPEKRRKEKKSCSPNLVVSVGLIGLFTRCETVYLQAAGFTVQAIPKVVVDSRRWFMLPVLSPERGVEARNCVPSKIAVNT